MRKFLIVLVGIILILTGCKSEYEGNESNDIITQENIGNEDDKIVYNEQKAILSEEKDISNNKKVEEVGNDNDVTNEKLSDFYDFSDLHNINESIKVANINDIGVLYYGKYRNVFIEENKSITDLSETSSSYPEISPNNNYIAYIDNYEFETIGNLWICDLQKGENIKKTQFDYDQTDTVKVVKWLDEQNLLVIIGFCYGTVTQGGSLYLYNLNDETLELLIESEKFMEFKDINIVGDKVILNKIIWKDDNYEEYDIQQEEKNINDFLR